MDDIYAEFAHDGRLRHLTARRAFDAPLMPFTTIPARRPSTTSSPLQGFLRSGRQDLNLRPPGPQPGALPDCATPRDRLILRPTSERATGVEPVPRAWKAPVQPLTPRPRVWPDGSRASSSGDRSACFRRHLAVASDPRWRPRPEPVIEGAVERDHRAAQRRSNRRREQGDQPGEFLKAAESLKRAGAGRRRPELSRYLRSGSVPKRPSATAITAPRARPQRLYPRFVPPPVTRPSSAPPRKTREDSMATRRAP